MCGCGICSLRERGTGRMKSKRRQIFYAAMSILIALTVWFYVSNDKSVEISVTGIPVEFLNEDTSLADKGFMRISGEEDVTVDLELKLARRRVFHFDPKDIRIVCDLSSVAYTGKQSVAYTILYPTGISSSDVTVKSPAVRTVQVEIGELSKKTVDIRYKVVGNVAEGYIAGSVQLLPSTLEVRGQQTDIMQISYAQVTLNIENATSTVVELLDYELYDFEDKIVNNRNVHPMSEQVQVTMPVLKVKDVPLRVEFVETPGSRKENFSWSLSHESVTLSGDAAVLANIDEIVLDTLALEDLRAEETFVYDIPIPEGIDNLSGLTSVTLSIRSSNIATKEIEAVHFGCEGYSGEAEVSVVTSSLAVTLRGTSEDIENVTADKVRVIADLSDIAAESGSYTVPARIEVEGYDIGAVGSYEVTVHIG